MRLGGISGRPVLATTNPTACGCKRVGAPNEVFYIRGDKPFKFLIDLRAYGGNEYEGRFDNLKGLFVLYGPWPT